MANSRFQNQVREGMVVRSADGEKLGKVRQLLANSFDIEKGFFFPKEYVVSYDEVKDIRGDELFISRTREELSEHGVEGLGRSDVTLGGTEAISTEEVRIPLVAEEIAVKKHIREAGEVRIHKEVITEERQITVPVMREVVRIENVAVTGAAVPAAAAIFREETIRIPVLEEELEITKHPVVREEVRVTKQIEEVPETVSATVRRERADVGSEGNVHQSVTPQDTHLENEVIEPLPKRTGTTG